MSRRFARRSKAEFYRRRNKHRIRTNIIQTAATGQHDPFDSRCCFTKIMPSHHMFTPGRQSPPSPVAFAEPVKGGLSKWGKLFEVRECHERGESTWATRTRLNTPKRPPCQPCTPCTRNNSTSRTRVSSFRIVYLALLSDSWLTRA